MFIEPREGVDVIVAKDSLPLEQLDVCLEIHMCNHVVEILKISAANFGKRGR